MVVTGLCALGAMGILCSLLIAIIGGGLSRISWEFITAPMEGVMGGGLRYQILGTCLLLGTAALVVTPFAIAISLLYTLFWRRHPKRRSLLAALHVLNATPSILFGILGFIIFVHSLGWEKSWLSGGIILAVMILPTVTVSLIQRIDTIPRHYLEGVRALGFSDGRVATSVLIPYGWGGLLTGLVIGLARAAGETAPILFTAAVFSGATVPSGIVDSPVLALSYHIFNLAQDVYGDQAMATAWAAATVLTSLVVAISLLAIPFRARSHEEAKR